MADIIFIYDEQDSGRVKDICAALSAAGVSCDPDRTVPVGQTYAAYQAQRLAAAKAVVMCWSEAALADSRLTDEAGAAKDAGKLAPVTLDGSLPPLGFRQIQTANLRDWPGDNAKRALDTLAAALRRMRDGVDSPSTLRSRWAAKAPFILTIRFWLLSLLTAAAIGALFFLSREGGRDMGESITARLVTLSAYATASLAFTLLSRAILHASRIVIGLDSRAFFSLEYLFIMAAALAGGFGMNALVRMSAPDSIGATASLFYTLWASATVLPLVLALILFVLRLVQRLVFGPVRAA